MSSKTNFESHLKKFILQNRNGWFSNLTLPRCLKNNYGLLFMTFFLMSSSSHAFAAENSACAQVKMVVAQELTLERQAFDAHMRINNGLDLVSVENVSVEVTFLDRNGKTVRASKDVHDDRALFFIRLNSLENINGVNGEGVVPPRTSADIHWLIIPAVGASMGVEAGTLYHVGATLSYTIGGEPHATTVTPDTIFVKPMPELVLDYFLPTDVHGDDPFTPVVEPPIPFSLGARVRNKGRGTARNLKIESAQPRITENEQGLLLGFSIVGSEVNGNEATKSFLVNFGDVPSHSSATARWLMTCSLSGRFVSFDAEFAHSDELGGELTSLMDSVNTHLLLHDVRVDLPGRDSIRDFLALDGDVLRVYESEGLEHVVTDRSKFAVMDVMGHAGSLSTYRLSMPATAGFVFAELEDPQRGAGILKQIVRSDGKQIKPENGWLAYRRIDGQTVRHTLSLFDVESTGLYHVVFDDAGSRSLPPVWETIGDQMGVEGRKMAFNVTATDPNGTIPALWASPLPAVSRFTDLGDGHGTFSWTPAAGQAGRYEITFTASDGRLEACQRVALNICSSGDSDCDGMSDAWELLHFASLSRDGTGDLDGDGVSDFHEFWRGTDPTRSNAPTTPVIVSPSDKSEVNMSRPEIIVQNGTAPGTADAVSYVFELYTEPAMTNLVAKAEGLVGTGGTTAWVVPHALRENLWHFVRVRATDGRNLSEWAYGSFFVNTVNDSPSDPFAASPKNGAEVDSLTPVLQVSNGRDPDGDRISYVFDVFADESLSTLVASSSAVEEGEDHTTCWTVATPLQNHKSYVWRVTAIDEHGSGSATSLSRFTVNTGNRAPGPPGIVWPPVGNEVASREVEMVISNADDADGDSLTYTFQADLSDAFDSPELMVSRAILEGSSVTRWSIKGLSDNAAYFWRVRASDGASQSPWVQTLTPRLQFNPSTDMDQDRISYRFEIYGDPFPSGLVASGESESPEWTVPGDLADNSLYRWRGRAVDEHGAESDWTDLSSFFVNNNGVDDPPSMVFEAPGEDLFVNSGEIAIRWLDDDPDSNAQVTIAFSQDPSGGSGTTIARGIQEDLDGPGDSVRWDIGGVGEGTYRIIGAIEDAATLRTCAAPGTVTVDRTPPVANAQPGGGIYRTRQRVTLSSSEPATLYFTLDGTEPHAGSPRYTSPIDISSTATLRFAAVDRAGNWSSPSSESYTISPEQPDARVDHFSVDAPARVQSGLGFMITLRALSSSGKLVRDFDGRVALASSAGTVTPDWTEGFRGGIWTGEASLSGAAGPVVLTASYHGTTGSSRPILVECDPPGPPVLSRPRDGARLTGETVTLTWHPVRGAVSYAVDLALDSKFSEVLLEEEGLSETSFTPPQSTFDGLEAGETVFWRVRAVNLCGAGAPGASRRFILGDKSRPRLSVLFPGGGETLSAGGEATIRWDYTGPTDSTVRLILQSGGAPTTTIASGIPARNEAFGWVLPHGSARNCRIVVECEQVPTVRAESGRFSIR